MMKNNLIQRNIYPLLSVVLMLLLFCSCDSNKPKQMLIAGSGWKQIVKYDLTNQKILWRHSLEKGEECNEVSAFSDDAVLYSFKKGAKVVDYNHKELWRYDAPEGTELQSASITSEGHILLGQCGSPALIMEFTKEGKMISKTSFDTGISRPHRQLRRVRKSLQGNYLVPIFGKGEVWEINPSGEILRKVSVGGVPFAVVELNENRWMVSCGDGHYMLEIDPNTEKVLNKMAENEIEEIPFRFVAQCVRLSNGNTLICNWGGHARKQKTVATLLELTPDRKVQWNLALSDSLGMISSVDPLWDEHCMK